MGTGDVLLDRVAPLDARIRDMHELRETNCSLSLDRRCEILQDALALTDSVLLRHELMYALGQLGNKASIPFLISVLRDDKYDSVTRHEAAEALGAIGDPVDHVLETIETMGNNTSESQELRETCYLALCRLRAIKKGCIPIRPPVEAEFVSVDPTPAHDDSSLTNEQLKEILRSHTDLWDRFRAMFALRDRGDAVSLSEVLMVDQTSALLRHEIAFVLGQMEDPRSVEALMAVMHQKHAASPEHPMVRHEVAEALGAIATPQCWEVIDQYAVPDHETSTLVRDSCIVAKDMFRYLQDWSMANR